MTHPDMRLYHALLRGDFPSRWLQLLPCPLVSTRCAWSGRGESVAELTSFGNFLLHSNICCSDGHASPYWTSIRRWISVGFTPSPRKKTNDRTLFLFGSRCKWSRYLYTTTAPSCCVPPSHCHLLATLQTMSITVAKTQDNRVVFRIFIRLLRFSFDSASYLSITALYVAYTEWGRN
jgi:hypothetical protein